MKTISKYIAIFIFTLASIVGLSSRSYAQIPGDLLSAGIQGGFQTSSVHGLGTGSYEAARIGIPGIFGEIRSTSWGGVNGANLHDAGYMIGTDFDILHLKLTGAVGLGASTYRANGATPVDNYTSLDWETQAMYHFNLVKNVLTAGIGANYVGTTPIHNSNAAPSMNGFGGVVGISAGF